MSAFLARRWREGKRQTQKAKVSEPSLALTLLPFTLRPLIAMDFSSFTFAFCFLPLLRLRRDVAHLGDFGERRQAVERDAGNDEL